MKKLMICLCGVTFIFFFGTLANGADKVDAKSLFEQKCSACHNSSRATSKIKTEEEWNVTVMRMKNVNGCRITDDEAKVIINYLTKNYGKAKES